MPGPYGPAAAYARRRGSDVLLVQRDGRTVTTVYAAGWSEDRAHRLASGTKSFAGALGIAATGAGLLSLDEPVADTITEWRSDPAKSRITVRELLDQSSGLNPSAGLPARDMYRAAINAPLTAAPGTTFDYGPNHYGVFAALVQRKMRAAGLHGDPLDYLEEHVFRPIGLHVSGWDRDAAGQPLFATGADLTARQWAKFGRLVAQQGRWNGRVRARAAARGRDARAEPGELPVWARVVAEPRARARGPRPAARRAVRPRRSRPAQGDQRLYVIASEHLVIVRFGVNAPFS